MQRSNLLRPASLPSFLSSLLALTCIVLVGALVYANTYQVPWYFDDLPVIVESQAVRDFNETLMNLLSSGRGVATLTFAINYHFGGFEVAGYHLVNLAIHLLSAWMVFLLLKRVFEKSFSLPLLGSLLFLVHPLQTQAVTYIVQRMTSLAGLFFFLAIYLYVRAREEKALNNISCPSSWTFYLLSLLCGALAVLTKQNAAVLPLAIFLFDRYFLSRQHSSDWKLFLPFFVAPALVAIQDVFLPMAGGKSLAAVSSMQVLVSSESVTPLKYLVTEFSVIWLYLRLLFLPYGQALDYGYPVVASVFAWRNLWPLLGILVLLWFAFYLRRRRPLISFGILWFFLALLVESTIIPLDPVFEHRLYVPMFGFVLVFIDGLRGILGHRKLVPALAMVLILLGLLTWNRNILWNDPVAFYEDNFRRAPNSERAALGLAQVYADSGRGDAALEVLEQAIELNPKYDQLYAIQAMVFIERELFDQAFESILKGLDVAPFSHTLLNRLGTLYDLLGQTQLAIEALDKAIAAQPTFSPAHLNLGVAYAGLGRWEDAIASYEKAIALSHEYPLAHFNLGVAYYSKKDLPAALKQFRIVVAQESDNDDALFNMASVALELGDRETAMAVLPRLRARNQRMAAELEAELRAASQ